MTAASTHGRPSAARFAAERIVRTLRDAGHLAYFAGGCVRDELLGLDPSDYDVATDALPERVVTLFPRASEVGKSFGVVIVRLGQEMVEVATFRSDGPYSDARRPDSVRFSTPQEDAARRDFTVNALFLDPTGNAAEGEVVPGVQGRVIDYVNGRADLSAKILRAVGDPERRLAEDHLRALRAARLAAKLGFEVDEATRAAIRAQASELRGVSRERIGDEVRRMMTHPTRERGAGLIEELDLIEPVLATEALVIGTARCLRHLPEAAPYPAALAAWALDWGAVRESGDIPRVVDGWRAALDLSNDERDGMRAALLHGAVVVGSHAGVWGDLSIAARKRAACSHGFQLGLDAYRGRWRDHVELAERDVQALASDGIGLRPDPFLSGETLIAMGLKPGPAFKKILDGAYDAQLEGRVKNLQEALELARTLSV